MSKKVTLDILVDADALVALAKEDDANHQRALKENNHLKKEKANYHISPFTIPEATTVMSYKVGQEKAKKLHKKIRSKSLFRYDFNQKVRQKADKIFLNQNNNGTSYFDCVNMALLNVYDLDGIFSFDQVYPKNNFSLTKEIVKHF